MKLRLFLMFLSVFLLVEACKKDDEYKPQKPGYEYYPLETYNLGMERIYDVDSIVYRQVSAKPDTFRYQVKETLKDTFTDLTGQLAFVVEKSIRNNDSSAWEINYLYTVNRNKQFGEEFYNNTRFVKMAFPVHEGKEFNSNIYNTHPETESRISNLNSSFNLNSLHFDSTMLVTYVNDSDFLNRDLHVERYATGVGMVSKDYIQIDKIVIGSTTYFEGSRYSYRLRYFSK